MKNISIAVPSTGIDVRLELRSGAATGQAVLIVSDEVEIRLGGPETDAKVPTSPKPAKSVSKQSMKLSTRDFDEILKRLRKLKPTKRVAAANSIKAMFQFDSPISDAEAGKILEGLRKRGSLTIDANDKVKFKP